MRKYPLYEREFDIYEMKVTREFDLHYSIATKAKKIHFDLSGEWHSIEG